MYGNASLQRTALDHLWLHFTRMGDYADPEQLQVMVRGDGCYLEDSRGRRYLDALAGLFCVNIGYGRRGDGRGRGREDAGAPVRDQLDLRARARSSWPPNWRRSRPGTSATRSSFGVARRRSKPL